jgi:hypothetical protein
MNELIKNKVLYLRPSRTIEIIKLGMNKRSNILYIYNYEGNHFRVFDSKKNIKNFLMNNDYDIIYETNIDKELDDYLFNKFTIQ